MTTKKAFFQLIYLIIISLVSKCMTLEATRIISNSSNFSVGCVEAERIALLKFKGSLKTSLRLSSWVDENCCKWEGVGCDNQIGNVVKLDLRSQTFCNLAGENRLGASFFCLGGELNPSLLDLKFLNYLDLSWNHFEGIVIPKFIGSLKNLTYLDLSCASFGGMVPPHLGNLSNLRYLSLDSSHSRCVFPGKRSWVSDLKWLSGLSSLKYMNLGYVNLSLAKTDWLRPINMLPSLSELHLPSCELQYLPQTLSFVNFTSLLVLNLRRNMFNSSIPQWLLNISTLTDIDISHSELIGPITEVVWGDLCSLRRVSLQDNKIDGEIISLLDCLSTCSNSSLEELHLGNNSLGGNLGNSLGELQKLKSLRLYFNSFSGSIPTSITRLLRLEELDLSFNSFSGSIPSFVGKLSSLQILDLSHNKMNGTIPESVGRLTKLKDFYLDDNSWEGVISATHFMELRDLSRFSLSSSNSSFTFHVRDDWIPSFSLLGTIAIKNCRVGPKFPAWLKTQKYLRDITLQNAAISDTIPDWLWTLSSYGFANLDLSGNQLRGKLPNTVNLASEASVLLGSNYLEGSLPLWPNLVTLSLRNNIFSGQIFEIGPEMQTLSILDISGNNLIGSIPTSINKLKILIWLDLSNNHLSGNIPRQWEEMNKLLTIDLSKNNLSGDIPSSICSLPSLDLLKLNNNNLSGELSPSLGNCRVLRTLDLGENKFSGNLPKWMGQRLRNLSRLRLRKNMFRGIIPEQLCNLSFLHILELAHNNLSGTIPPCLGKMAGFQYLYDYASSSYMQTEMGWSGRIIDVFYQLKMEKILKGRELAYSSHTQMELVMKGRLLEYKRTLSLVNLIDLSNNNLRGEIPREITNLSTLGTLNLSRNQLIGKIPEEIGALQRLETLDLSSNHLLGPIPPSMTSITSLSSLNLSHNNLSGQIPSTNQFHTWIDPSIYEGNLLCGPPLPTPCSTSTNSNNTEDKDDEDEVEDEDEDWSDKLWFFVSVALGFIIGFWVVCCSLVVKKSWRDAYFQFLNDMKDRIFVFIAVNVARIQRKMKFQNN